MQTKLEPIDFTYYDAARRGLERAQAALDLVHAVLAPRYNLSTGDSITPTGEIIRLTDPITEPQPQQQEEVVQ